MAEQQQPAEGVTSALAVIKTVVSPIAEIAERNIPVIIEKTAKVKTFLSKVKVINDDATDKWANDALVKIKPITEEVDKLRKEITKKTDAVKDALMIPEKEMLAEIDRIKKLRNEYATQQAQAAKAAQEKIDKEKRFTIHVAEVKQRIITKVETGVASKVAALENAIAEMFNKMTLENAKQIEAQIVGLKPKLKEDFFATLFDVEYDSKIMTAAQFAEVQAKAKAYEKFKYEAINKVYAEFALKVCVKWKAQIGPRIIELERIKSAPTDQAEKMKKAAADRAVKEEADRKKAEDDKKKKIELAASEETQKTVLEAEFDAQIKTQSIEEQDGVRKRKVYRLTQEGELDMLKIAKVISSAIVNVLTTKGATAIFKREKNGNIKQDEDGHAIYVDGVQHWLDELSTLGYTPQIEHIKFEEKVTKVTKK